MALLFETMLLTGIRPECACGLKWKALDLENNELIINNAYKDFIVYDDNMKSIGHERHDDKLKTPESYRRIPLNPRLRKILLKHKNEQQELFKRARALKNKHKKWSENEYMFLGRNYFPYVAETLCYGMRKFYKKYNLEKITPYGLRHSFATYCSENGMEEIVLMKLMGHTDFQTTQKYYIRVSAKRKRLAMQDAYKVVFFEREAS
jgi:integrase